MDSARPLPASFQASFQAFIAALRSAGLPPSALRADEFTRIAYSRDASFYQLTPQLVVTIENMSQMVTLLQTANHHQIAITFRAAGTSLSGQAVTDSVLVLLSEHWRDAQILDDGAKIKLQPGLTGAQVNALLKPYRRKIGPDPASIQTCRIGGIAANNASGMCCGVQHNSYHTLAAMTLILADGTVLDTGSVVSVASFRQSHAKLLNELASLRAELLAQPQLTDKVRHKYRLKNTTGYGINALLDFADPAQILAHLLIGSEGTLGFIADITYHTVPDPAHKSLALYFFADLTSCCAAVSQLAALAVTAVELMDAGALRSVMSKPGMPAEAAKLPAHAAALLIEVACEHGEALAGAVDTVSDLLRNNPALLFAVPFTADAQLQQQLWDIRKGTFPAVGAMRAKGSTVIIEDVAVPVDMLGAAVADLQQLLMRHQYADAIIFGHALDGNVHFVFSQTFDSPREVDRYDSLMQDVTRLIVDKYGGSLKAEHGTGRNMAPFVAQEWGTALYRMMQRIKAVFDPQNILNPGVLLNDDPAAHLKHLKQLPAVHDEIDRCMECGFCEPVCPSNGFTLTPRQRIAVARQLKQAKLADIDRHDLLRQFQFEAIDSCAATGLCATKCPVGINTGEFVRDWRAGHTLQETPAFNGSGPFTTKASVTQRWQVKHWHTQGIIARFAIHAGRGLQHILGVDNTRQLTTKLNQLSGHLSPVLPNSLPRAAASVLVSPDHLALTVDHTTVVLLPSCPERWFAESDQCADQRPLHMVLASVLAKAGLKLFIPDGYDHHCCGQPMLSQGQRQLAEQQREQSVALLAPFAATAFALVTDAAPCALQLQQKRDTASQVQEQVQVQELSAFLATILPRLNIKPVAEPIALHLTCSSQKLGDAAALRQLADACAVQVVIPEQVTCCGFAGDKGFMLPELNQNALRHLATHLPEACRQGFSNSKTCQIGLTEQSGRSYQHLVYLLDAVSFVKCSENGRL